MLGTAAGPGATINFSITKGTIQAKVVYTIPCNGWKYSTTTPAGQTLQIEARGLTDNKSTEPNPISYAMMKRVAYITTMSCFREAVPSDLLADKYWMFRDVDYDKKLVGHYHAHGKEHGPCYLCYLKKTFPELAVKSHGSTSTEMLPRWVVELLAVMFTT